MSQTWTELARRAVAVLRIWYRHDVRRWWRRHVTTHRLRRHWDDRPSSNPAMCALAEANVAEYLALPNLGYQSLPIGTPIEINSDPIAGIIGSRRPTGMWTDVEASMRQWSQLDENAKRSQERESRLKMLAAERARLVYQDLRHIDDSIDMIAGLNPYLLPRPDDEPT